MGPWVQIPIMPQSEKKERKKKEVVGCHSVVEHLPSMCKVLDSIPRTTNTNKQKQVHICCLYILFFFYVYAFLPATHSSVYCLHHWLSSTAYSHPNCQIWCPLWGYYPICHFLLSPKISSDVTSLSKQPLTSNADLDAPSWHLWYTLLSWSSSFSSSQFLSVFGFLFPWLWRMNSSLASGFYLWSVPPLPMINPIPSSVHWLPNANGPHSIFDLDSCELCFYRISPLEWPHDTSITACTTCAHCLCLPHQPEPPSQFQRKTLPRNSSHPWQLFLVLHRKLVIMACCMCLSISGVSPCHSLYFARTIAIASYHVFLYPSIRACPPHRTRKFSEVHILLYHSTV
jgi:hypothetical protein